MSYKISLSSEIMRKLFLLKTFCGRPPIVEQIRGAVRSYVADQEARIGTSVEDAADAIEEYEAPEEREKEEE